MPKFYYTEGFAIFQCVDGEFVRVTDPELIWEAKCDPETEFMPSVPESIKSLRRQLQKAHPDKGGDPAEFHRLMARLDALR